MGYMSNLPDTNQMNTPWEVKLIVFNLSDWALNMENKEKTSFLLS